MAKAGKPQRLRPRAQGLSEAIREFLTPAVFRQVRKAVPRRNSPRWDLHPLLYVILLLTWCSGDSLPEKFEAARAFYVVCCPKRRRPGRGFSGFERALAKLPMPILRALAAAVRRRAACLFGDRMRVEGFVPLGCDGTRQECPRTEELERRLGTFGKDGAPPMIWNTSIVHLALGFPWCWRWGKGGKASERAHLIRMLPLLPPGALVVADAGYVGYDVVRKLVLQPVDFLIRMSSNATFYTETHGALSKFREGIVYYWPKRQQDQGNPPIRGRLIRVSSRKHKTDVWLLTNIEDRKRLPTALAERFYRWRWENEGFFRTYKRTLKNLKLMSRSVRLVHREAEASMIATQLLLCQGALALTSRESEETSPLRSSPRRVLLEIRREMIGRNPTKRSFAARLAEATRERRQRRTPKQKREWPRRKTHQPPHPPILLRLTKPEKIAIERHLQAA